MNTQTVAGFRIEQNIPIPSWRKGPSMSPTNIALQALKPGDSFAIPKGKHVKNSPTMLYAAAKKSGIKIALRKMEDGALRVWRTA